MMILSVDNKSVALAEADLEMTVDEGISHFQKLKNGCTIHLYLTVRTNSPRSALITSWLLMIYLISSH